MMSWHFFFCYSCTVFEIAGSELEVQISILFAKIDRMICEGLIRSSNFLIK